MRDIHCHILYGIDDGSKELEQSIRILENANNNGITDICLTPHYILDTKFDCNNKEKVERLNVLKEELVKRNININLYLGNEIMINDEIIDLINNDEVSTINNSKYILIEFPLRNKGYDYDLIIFNLIRKGYRVILAHPERYEYVRKDITILDKLLDMGVILQSNYLSLFDRYGKDARKCLKRLLKDRKISLLASDIHRDSTDYRLKDLHKKLKFLKDKEYIDDLLENNFMKIINNEDI